jgi:hypothetical protein
MAVAVCPASRAALAEVGADVLLRFELNRQLSQQLRSLAEKVAFQAHSNLAKELQKRHSWIGHSVLLLWFSDHSRTHTMALLAGRIYTTL